MKLSILHKGLLIVSVPLLFEVFFVVVLVNQIDQTSVHINRELRSHDIIIGVETVLKEIAASTTNAVIYNVTRKEELLDNLKKSHKNILTSTARLKRLTKDDEEERSIASQITSSARDWIKNQQRVIDLDPQSTLGAFFTTRGNVANLLVMHSEGANRALIEKEREIQSIEPRLLRDSIFRIQALLIFGAIVNITITVLLAAYFARYISQRLDNVLTNTFKLGARMELNPPMRGEDEIAELDQALHHTATEIIEFETFKEQLIGVVSHELRTPLTSIQGTLTLLQAGVMGTYPASLQKEVEDTQVQLTRLINLVNDLLLVERLESGSQIIKEQEIKLIPLIESAYQIVQQQYQAANPEVIISGDQVETIGDSTQLEKVFSILLLISQSRMAGERESLVVVSKSLDGISIVIEDNGKKIEESYKVQYFTKGAGKINTSEVPGLDVLSKALAKAIINAHGGKLELDSAADATSFIITLPYRRRHND